MSVIRHLMALALVVLLLGLAWIEAPRWLGSDPARITLSAPTDSLQQKSGPLTAEEFRDTLAKELPALKILHRKSRPVDIWLVGKGVAIPVYLLKAQRRIVSLGGHVLRMEELNGGPPAARLSWEDSLGDSSTVELRMGDAFLTGSSSLAVGFTLDSALTVAEMQALSTLSVPYALLVQPFDTTPSLSFDLDRLPNKEVIAWVGMEPHRYPWISPGPHSILIHHSEKEISALINEAARRLPAAVGIATRMGERAVEHKPLLQALLRASGKQDWWFLDLTRNRFSVSQEVCSSLQTSCQKANPLQRGHNADKYLASALASAEKTGQNIAILPLSLDNIAAYQAMLPAAEAQGTEIVKLSTLVNQSP
ncbi:MAG TPA: divergent polysaccharide deacetylase family protein [Fibrobacteraceae bacterium]|nr:divergent polysaccharide deacetylase family protein [Fibrobacteraceae bacterium]